VTCCTANHWLTAPAEAQHAKVDLWICAICAICGLQVHRLFNRVRGSVQFFTLIDGGGTPRLLGRWQPGDPCPRDGERGEGR